MKIRELTSALEKLAPTGLQESYDNSGLLLGNPDTEMNKALITLDVTEDVIREAIESGCELIIAHHPVIFKGLKRLTGSTLTERLVIQLIKNDLAVYAIHTNLDNIAGGVNKILAQKLGLTNFKILSPGKGSLKKLVTFCPTDHADKVREAMFKAGAGHIGNYDSCSYNLAGEGTFRGSEDTDPFAGEKGKLHFEPEIRVETIVPDSIIGGVVQAMIKAHPYEEVAYDIYPLDNLDVTTGAGMIGELENPLTGADYLKQVKKILGSRALKYSGPVERKISTVAICGGSGAFLIPAARRAGAELFITGDIKYHDYFEFNDNMIVADAGHYETEQYTKELLHSELKEKFPNFALLISKIDTNPIRAL
jgi:dinuclear metal center YbgI/SA1388 family protein